MKLTTVARPGIEIIAHFLQRLNRTFDRIKFASEMIKKDTGICLTVKGKPLANYKSEGALLEALKDKGITPWRLETNLKLLDGALKQYEDMYSKIFKGTGLAFVGEPEIEIPLMLGKDEKIGEEWIRQIVISNIFNAALDLSEDLELTILKRDVPILNEKNALPQGRVIDWSLKEAHEIFITLYYLKDAMEFDKDLLRMGVKINLNDFIAPVLAHVKKRHGIKYEM